MRRTASIFAALLLTWVPSPACQASAGDHPGRDTRMVILGIDGLDPVSLREYMARGLLPNFSRLASQGGFMPLGTSVPPQSPVAWSNFITGMDSGGHGIFDFIALDRGTMLPYLSTARVEQPDRKPLAIGDWRIPLASAKTLQLRDGRAFWEILEEHGIQTTMFRIPANYPPVKSGGRAISGMGTPDLRGSSGMFSFYTSDPAYRPGALSGGEIHRVRLKDFRTEITIEGPPNPLRKGNPASTTSVVVHVDPTNPVAAIRAGEEQVLLNVGEWSDWVSLSFDFAPGLVAVDGMVRFLLKETRPHLSLYASPVNIDPRNPAQPISVPAEYAFELAEAAGPFYTQEMPEDTKALSARVLTAGEFLQQSALVLDERRRLLKAELAKFRDAGDGQLLFFYFSSVDQRNHMLARHADPEHPFHEANTPAYLAQAMRDTYREMDDILGGVMRGLDDSTHLLVMSDHGFAPFKRQANLNTWLEQQGYLRLNNPARRNAYDWLQGVDWRRTRAFAIGLNSLYLNVKGRERFGIVSPGDRAALAREIADRLATWTDGEQGPVVVSQPLLREEIYHGPYVEAAPDILVGYAPGYRASWATTTGKVPAGLLEQNLEEWSGDHCMDARAVPGVLLSNQALIPGAAGDLMDLTVSVLTRFGIEAPSTMRGASVFPDPRGEL